MEEHDKVVAYFSLTNDAIKKDDVSRSAFKRALKLIHFSKRYTGMPSAKIGRLGVSSDIQSNGYGSKILDFLKVWFTTGNKTGCRFLVVDANNNGRAIQFYKRNGFLILSQKDEEEDTRLMYFDLMTFKP